MMYCNGDSHMSSFLRRNDDGVPTSAGVFDDGYLALLVLVARDLLKGYRDPHRVVVPRVQDEAEVVLVLALDVVCAVCESAAARGLES